MRSHSLVLFTVLLIGLAGAMPSAAQRVVRADMAVSPDGQVVVTGSGTGTLLVWDADTWTLRHRHRVGDTVLFGFDVSPDNRHIAFGTRSGRLAVYSLEADRLVFDVQDRAGSVSAARFGPDGRLFAAGQGRALTVYRWDDGERLASFDLGAEGEVEDFDVLPERNQLFIAHFRPGRALLMDAATGAVVHTWRNKPRPRDGSRAVKDVAVRPGTATGTFAGVGGDVIAVNLDTGARLDSVQVHPDFVSHLVHAPNGRLAATDLDGTTTLLDPGSLQILRRMSQDASFQSRRLLFTAAFRPGTPHLITGGIRLPLIVWDTATGERLRTVDTL